VTSSVVLELSDYRWNCGREMTCNIAIIVERELEIAYKWRT